MRLIALALVVVAAAAAVDLDVRCYGPDDALLRVAIVCGQHPRERFAWDVCQRWARLWQRTPPSLMHITLIADANPSGRAIWEANASMACWRGNGAGVDLNRNWPVPRCALDAVPETWVHEAPWPSGAHALSEPETQALADVLAAAAPHVLISLHSGTRALLAPYDGCARSTPARLDQMMQLARWLRRGVCDDCTVASSAAVLGEAHGTLTDWAYEVLGVPFVYTWELWAPATATPDCAAAFGPPPDTPAYTAALAQWDAVPRRLVAMDTTTWLTLLRWMGIVYDD